MTSARAEVRHPLVASMGPSNAESFVVVCVELGRPMHDQSPMFIEVCAATTTGTWLCTYLSNRCRRRTSDAELFAVATEWLFEAPLDLRARLPAVHDLGAAPPSRSRRR